MRHALADGSDHVAIACDGGTGLRARGGFGRRRGWAGGCPAARVDALGWACAVSGVHMTRSIWLLTVPIKYVEAVQDHYERYDVGGE